MKTKRKLKNKKTNKIVEKEIDTDLNDKVLKIQGEVDLFEEGIFVEPTEQEILDDELVELKKLKEQEIITSWQNAKKSVTLVYQGSTEIRDVDDWINILASKMIGLAGLEKDPKMRNSPRLNQIYKELKYDVPTKTAKFTFKVDNKSIDIDYNETNYFHHVAINFRGDYREQKRLKIDSVKNALTKEGLNSINSTFLFETEVNLDELLQERSLLPE